MIALFHIRSPSQVQILKIHLNDNDIEDEVWVVNGKFTLYKMDGNPVVKLNTSTD